MTENIKTNSNFQPRCVERKIPKAAKPQPAASNQYSKSDSQLQENRNCNKVREEKRLTNVTNTKPDSLFPMVTISLESASAGSAKVTETKPESPKKVNPEDEKLSASKLEANNQPMQDSQSVETTAKNSNSSSSSSSGGSGSTDTMTSTDSAKKSVITPTSGEDKKTKKLLDSGDKIHDTKSPSAKQQARSVLLKNNPDDETITVIDNFF